MSLLHSILPPRNLPSSLPITPPHPPALSCKAPFLRQGLWCPRGSYSSLSQPGPFCVVSVRGWVYVLRWAGTPRRWGQACCGRCSVPSPAQHRARHKGSSLEVEWMNEHANQALLESGFGGFSHSSHWQLESSWKEVHPPCSPGDGSLEPQALTQGPPKGLRSCCPRTSWLPWNSACPPQASAPVLVACKTPCHTPTHREEQAL